MFLDTKTVLAVYVCVIVKLSEAQTLMLLESKTMLYVCVHVHMCKKILKNNSVHIVRVTSVCVCVCVRKHSQKHVFQKHEHQCLLKQNCVVICAHV